MASLSVPGQNHNVNMLSPRPSASFTGQAAHRAAVAVCAVVVLMVFLIFGRTGKFGFSGFDDGSYFASNDHVKAGLTWAGAQWAFQTGYASNWHPLTWLSLMLDAQLFGTGAKGPHLTNVFLHAANAVLLFLWLRRLTGDLWRCAFVAAVFAIHPLRVESVAWVSERKDVLSGLFFMLTLMAYSVYVEQANAGNSKSRIYYLLAIFSLALGLMSKSMLVTTPFVLLLLDFWPLKRFSESMLKRLLWEKLPFFLLSAASCAMTLLAQGEAIKSMVVLPLALRIGNAPISYVTYLIQMFWPANLVVYYPYHYDTPVWQMLGAAIILLVITLLAIVTVRRSPYFLTGWLWYLGMTVPAIGLVQVGGQAHADRYTYLPQIGLYLAIVWAAGDWSAAWRWRHGRRALAAAALAVIGALMLCSWNQTDFWRTDERLWKHTLDCTTGNYNAHNNLGYVLAGQGRNAEAIEQYEQALELYPDYAEAENNLGALLLNQGRMDEAAGHFQRAIEMNPTCADVFNNLGLAFSKQGRASAAIECYQKAEALSPDGPEVYNNFGNLLATLGRNPEAVEQYKQALAIAPDNAKVHFNLANVLAAQGRVDEAIEHFQQALKQLPDSIHARYQLALLLQSRGDFAAAMEQLGKILQLDPKHVAAQNNLAWLLATCPDDALRDGRKAVGLAEQAVRLSGGTAPEILDTLAAAYAETGQFSEAMDTADRALKLAAMQNNKPLVDAIQSQLKFYEARSPFREIRTNGLH
jgi:protein O-mannosyl-transferase